MKAFSFSQQPRTEQCASAADPQGRRLCSEYTRYVAQGGLISGGLLGVFMRVAAFVWLIFNLYQHVVQQFAPSKLVTGVRSLDGIGRPQTVVL